MKKKPSSGHLNISSYMNVKCEKLDYYRGAKRDVQLEKLN